MRRKILDIQNLNVSFDTAQGERTALHGVSLHINSGETVGIVGESGSGKSVTCLAAMGLLPMPPAKITSGKLLYTHTTGETVDLAALDMEAMRKYRGKEMAMIFQEPMTSLNPVFSCGTQLTEAIQVHEALTAEAARTRALELFEKVKLPEPERIFDAYPHELSGGQKQRVMIAMALSCQPKLLIADEPTTALDVTVQRHILTLLKDLQQQTEAAILFISHDLGVIAEVADRVVVMYKGEVVETGPVAELFKNPQHPYTKSLLACRPPLDYRLRRLPVVSDFMEVSLTENGRVNIQQKQVDTQSLVNQYRVSPKETQQRLTRLQQAPPILEVRNLSTWYPKKKNFFGKTTDYLKAVQNVSFNVHKGEILGLVGESGCGKTTLGRSLLNLAPTRQGQVLYRGENILDISPKKLRALRRKIQIIFQDPFAALNPRMPIGRAITEPMKVHGLYKNAAERRARAAYLLESVNLDASMFERYPHEFSGGQRQRICIARALAVEPEFIVCDESVSALDVSVQAQVLNLLLTLREKFDLTYIFISHDLSVVKFLCDRMLVMQGGQILEHGPADQVYSTPQHPYTKTLIDAIPKGL